MISTKWSWEALISSIHRKCKDAFLHMCINDADDQVPSDTMLIKYFIYFLVTKKNKITTYR